MSAQFISFPVTLTLPLAPTILTSRLWEADSSRGLCEWDLSVFVLR